jgi:hypothetical protein
MKKRWTYNLADYRQIFALTEADLQKNILDYPAGIASVNAQLYAKGLTIVSGDPAYHLSYPEMKVHARRLLQENIIASRDQVEPMVIAEWEHNTEQFLADYDLGKKQQRYRAMSVPPSPVSDIFDLLLCADLLFNGNHESAVVHDWMSALCRLAAEVRIFPLPADKSVVQAELGPVMLALQQRHFGVEIRAVQYPQRHQANAMLRIWAKECTVTE